MELAIGLLERLGDALHLLHDLHGLKEEGIDQGRVPDDADDRLVLAPGDVRLETAPLDPVDEVAKLRLGRRILDYRDHARPPAPDSAPDRITSNSQTRPTAPSVPLAASHHGDPGGARTHDLSLRRRTL